MPGPIPGSHTASHEPTRVCTLTIHDGDGMKVEVCGVDRWCVSMVCFIISSSLAGWAQSLIDHHEMKSHLMKQLHGVDCNVTRQARLAKYGNN